MGLSKEKLAELDEAIKRIGTIRGVVREVGVCKQTVQSRARKIGYKFETSPVECKESREEILLKNAALLERRKLLNDVESEHSFRAYLSELLEEVITPFKPEKPKPIKPSTKAKERFPLLHLSDWHFEEIVKKDSVMGLNEYSIPISCKRVKRIISNFKQWADDQQSSKRIVMPKLTVALNGDFLTGTLHGLERHSGAPNICRSAVACGRLIAMAIQEVASIFKEVEVICTVGNHGRLPDDRKVPTKDPTRNWDYIAYMMAKEILREQTNVVWRIPESYGAVYEVGGNWVYQSHGNFIRGGNLSIIGYSMVRFTSNLKACLQAAGRELKYAIFGHYHQSNMSEFAGLRSFINPSLIGTQEYSFLSRGAANFSAQDVYVFDRDHGYCATETFYGEGNEDFGSYVLTV